MNVALPGFLDVFNADMHQVQWIITGFNLAAGIVVPVASYVMKKIGLTLALFIVLIGITLSSILCSISWDINSLIMFRIIQGMFCGLIQPISLSMVYIIVAKDKQAVALSIWSFSTVFATSIGPTLSGWLLLKNWHLIFLVIVPISLVIAFIALKKLPKYKRDDQLRLDWFGLLTATFGSFSLLLFFGNLTVWEIQSIEAIITLSGGIVLLFVFVWWQLRHKFPLLNLRLFANPIFTLSVTISICLTFGLYSAVYFIPFYLVEIKGLNTFETGLVFIPAAVVLSFATLLNGYIYRYISPVKVLLIGTSFIFFSTIYLSQLTIVSGLTAIVIVIALRNFGTGLSMNPVTSISMSVIKDEYISQASTITTWFRQVMSAVVLGINTSLFSNVLQKHLNEANYIAGTAQSQDIYRIAFMKSINFALFIAVVIIGIAVILTIVVFFVQKKQMELKIRQPIPAIKSETLA